MNKRQILESKLRKIIREEILFLKEGRFSRPNRGLKWEETGNEKFPLSASFLVPFGKIGIAFYTKEQLQKFFTTKLNKLLNASVDLSSKSRDDFWTPDGRNIRFEFQLDGINYLVKSGGATSKAQYYNILKSK